MYVPVLSPHGLRCGSSSRCPGHGRPESPPFSVSPCLGLHRISWNGGIVTFENCPHGLRNWKREGLGACARLGYALTQRRLHLPAQNALSGWLRSSEWLVTNAFQNCKTNFSAGTPAGLPNLLRKDADKTPASSPPKSDGAAANLLRLPAFESIITSWNLSFSRSVYTTCTLNPSHRGARWWWSSLSLT